MAHLRSHTRGELCNSPFREECPRSAMHEISSESWNLLTTVGIRDQLWTPSIVRGTTLPITSIKVQPEIDELLLYRRYEQLQNLLINSSELPIVIGVIDIEIYPQFCWDIDIIPVEKPIQAIVRLYLLRVLGKVSRRPLGSHYDSTRHGSRW